MRPSATAFAICVTDASRVGVLVPWICPQGPSDTSQEQLQYHRKVGKYQAERVITRPSACTLRISPWPGRAAARIGHGVFPGLRPRACEVVLSLKPAVALPQISSLVKRAGIPPGLLTKELESKFRMLVISPTGVPRQPKRQPQCLGGHWPHGPAGFRGGNEPHVENSW